MKPRAVHLEHFAMVLVSQLAPGDQRQARMPQRDASAQRRAGNATWRRAAVGSPTKNAWWRRVLSNHSLSFTIIHYHSLSFTIIHDCIYLNTLSLLTVQLLGHRPAVCERQRGTDKGSLAIWSLAHFGCHITMSQLMPVSFIWAGQQVYQGGGQPVTRRVWASKNRRLMMFDS